MIPLHNVETKATGLWQSFAQASAQGNPTQDVFWGSYDKLIAKSKKQRNTRITISHASVPNQTSTNHTSTIKPFVFVVDDYQKKEYLLDQFKQTVNQLMMPLVIAGCFLNIVILLQNFPFLGLIFLNILGGVICLSVFFCCFQKRISELKTLIEISPKSLTRTGGGFRSINIHYYDIAEVRHSNRGLSIICYDSIHSKDRMHEAMVIPRVFKHYNQAQALIEHYLNNHRVRQIS